MEFDLILSFIVTSAILIIMPGPDSLFVLSESITKGRRHGLITAVGLSTGALFHTLAAAAGLSIIIQQSVLVFSMVKYLGALYLFYLAYKALKENRISFNTPIENGEPLEKVDSLTLIKRGFFASVLNPKISIFFIAFLPQFISIHGFNSSLQMIILGLIFMMLTCIIFAVIAILASRLTKYMHNQNFWKATKWGKVSVFASLGTSLALSQR